MKLSTHEGILWHFKPPQLLQFGGSFGSCCKLKFVRAYFRIEDSLIEDVKSNIQYIRYNG